jgi:hypothetical protein
MFSSTIAQFALLFNARMKASYGTLLFFLMGLLKEELYSNTDVRITTDVSTATDNGHYEATKLVSNQ